MLEENVSAAGILLFHFQWTSYVADCSSSARNFMIYQRPPVGALQNWADAVDDQSYTFDSFLPYYKKSPQFTQPGPKRAANATAGYNAGAFSSTGGPLQVSAR